MKAQVELERDRRASLSLSSDEAPLELPREAAAVLARIIRARRDDVGRERAGAA